jgi:N-acetylmuramoyl-L-alanine amidase
MLSCQKKCKANAARGWKQVGYTDMILLSGVPVRLVANNEDDVPWMPGRLPTVQWQCINYTARHIVYVGGTDKKAMRQKTRAPKSSFLP